MYWDYNVDGGKGVKMGENVQSKIPVVCEKMLNTHAKISKNNKKEGKKK